MICHSHALIIEGIVGIVILCLGLGGYNEFSLPARIFKPKKKKSFSKQVCLQSICPNCSISLFGIDSSIYFYFLGLQITSFHSQLGILDN